MKINSWTRTYDIAKYGRLLILLSNGDCNFQCHMPQFMLSLDIFSDESFKFKLKLKEYTINKSYPDIDK